LYLPQAFAKTEAKALTAINQPLQNDLLLMIPLHRFLGLSQTNTNALSREGRSKS
jgi:hypothetical protein